MRLAKPLSDGRKEDNMSKRKFLDEKEIVAEFKALHDMMNEKYETLYSVTKDQFVVYKGKGKLIHDYKLLGNGTIRIGLRKLERWQGNKNTNTYYLRTSWDGQSLYLNMKTGKFLEKRLESPKKTIDEKDILEYIKKNMSAEDLIKAIVGK